MPVYVYGLIIIGLCFLLRLVMIPLVSMLSISQPPAAAPAKMEGPAQLLTLAPVMWGGLERSVKQVREWVTRQMQLAFYSTLHWWLLDGIFSSVCTLYSVAILILFAEVSFLTTNLMFALFQLLAVVILVLPQMVNAVSPVQPTTL